MLLNSCKIIFFLTSALIYFTHTHALGLKKLQIRAGPRNIKILKTEKGKIIYIPIKIYLYILYNKLFYINQFM